MTRIMNATMSGSNNDTPTFNFAGRHAYYQAFGIGEWYGDDIAVVAASLNHDTYVIGWADGYIRGTRPDIEEQVDQFIKEDHVLNDLEPIKKEIREWLIPRAKPPFYEWDIERAAKRIKELRDQGDPVTGDDFGMIVYEFYFL